MISLKKLKEDLVYPDAKTVEFEGDLLFIKQNLPSIDKYTLIKAMVGSLELDSNYFDPYLAELLFEVRIVLAYSNIQEDNEEGLMNVFEQHDVLENNGLIDLVIKNIPVKEYEDLIRLYKETYEAAIAFNSNIGNLLVKIAPMIQDFLPSIAQELEQFDPDKINILNDSLTKINKKINNTEE